MHNCDFVVGLIYLWVWLTTNSMHTSNARQRDKTSIKYQGAINWNSLPVSLKSCSSKEKFLGLLKDFFLDNINSSQS